VILSVSVVLVLSGLLVFPYLTEFITSALSGSFNNNAGNNRPNVENAGETASRQVIVVMENIPPYSYTAGDSVYGFDVELSSIIFKKLNVKPLYETHLWTQCLEMMKNREADAILTVFLTVEREKYLYFPDEYCSYEPNAFFRLKEKNITYSGSLSELKDYKIGVKTSTSYGNQFDNAKFLERDSSATQEILIRKIIEKRLEIGIGSIPVISYISRKLNYFNKITFVEPYVSVEPLYIGFSKKTENYKLAQSFSAELSILKKSLTYNYLLKKYDIIDTITR
jgi:polar amino acid transport system substrate-binding protein